MKKRFESQYHNLAAKLASASADGRRAVMVHACKAACEQANILQIEAVSFAVSKIADVVSEGLLDEIQGLADDFDRRYMDLCAAGDEEGSIILFSQARACYSIYFALIGDEASVGESVYESLAACSSGQELANDLERML